MPKEGARMRRGEAGGERWGSGGDSGGKRRGEKGINEALGRRGRLTHSPLRICGSGKEGLCATHAPFWAWEGELSLCLPSPIC